MRWLARELRILNRRQSLTVAACLAIGLAATAGALSVLEQLWRRHGLGEDGLVWVMAEDLKLGVRTSPSTRMVQEWKRGLRCCRVDGFAVSESSLRSGAGSRTVRMAFVGDGLFKVLDSEAVVGRSLEAAAPADRRVSVMVSRELAHREFGDERKALGRAVMVDGRPLTIIGVFSRQLTDLLSPGTPIGAVRSLEYGEHDAVQALGRLRSGVSLSRAKAEIEAWTSVDAGSESESQSGLRWTLLSAWEVMDPTTLRIFRIAVIGALVVIIVTGSTIAHLVGAQVKSRAREFAIRSALGAGRWKLFGHSLGQALFSTLLAAIGAAALAGAGLNAMTVILPEDIRFLSGVGVDAKALGAACCAGFLIVLLPGVSASLFRSSANLSLALRNDPRFGTRSARGATVANLHIVTMAASSFVVAVATYLVIETAFALGRTDLGFEVDGLQAVEVKLPAAEHPSQQARAAFFTTFLERMSSLPGVESVAAATSAPPESGVFFGEIALGTGGRDAVEPSAVGRVGVGPGYFRTLRQQVLAGREFSEADARSQMTVVISAAAARHLGARLHDAIGQRIRLGDETREVIGVVENVRTPGLAQSLGGLLVYWPLDDYRDSMTILARVDEALEPAFRRAALNLDRNVIVEPAPMRELLARSLAELHFLTRLFALIALLAVALAVGGVYAVLNNLVVEQRGQIALRLAIGATREQVRRWVLWKGESRALVGLVVGTVLSYPFCRLFASQLYGVESGSIEARLAAAVLILAATAGGALVPAVRTSRLDPHEVLKGN